MGFKAVVRNMLEGGLMTVLDARDVTKVYREGSGCVAVLNGASLALTAARSWHSRGRRDRGRRHS